MTTQQNTTDLQLPLQVGQKEAARLLGYSERFLRDIPDIPCVRVGTSVRYRVKDLEAWIEKRAKLQGERGKLIWTIRPIERSGSIEMVAS